MEAKYEMPALTDENEREQLILAASIIYEYPNNDPRLIKVAQIAMAALTAEPVAYVHPAYLQAGALGFDASVRRLAPAQVELHTAPPVPALKPIDLTSCKRYRNGSYLNNESVMEEYEFGESLDRNEVLNAIRAAGYEVKE